jgi:BMFP domain-containing protein YqiC
MSMAMMALIKELREQVRALEARVAELEKKKTRSKKSAE